MSGFLIGFIPPLEKFVKHNISSFLVKYTVYMASCGRMDEDDLAVTILFFLDESVQEGLMATKAYKERDWEGVQKWLRDRYKWFDERVGKAQLEAFIQK